MSTITTWLLRLFRPGKHGELGGKMLAMGEPITRIKDITHPFVIAKGRRRLELQVEEAEDLRDWLTRQLERKDVRRPIIVTYSCTPR